MAQLDVSPSIRDALVVGFGGGSGTEPLVALGVSKVELVEINSTLLRQERRLAFFRNFFDAPNLHITVDDIRRFFNRNPDRKFDIISFGAPLLSTVVYSNNLFSREFFEMVKAHLRDDGTFMVHDNSDNLVKTLSDVFPYVVLRCDIFLIASLHPISRQRDVEGEMSAHFGQRFDQLVADRRRQCSADPATVSYDLKVPELRDRAPILEFHLGRSFRRGFSE